jgi:glutamate-1-semialdehyde 2,1-aminomutase
MDNEIVQMENEEPQPSPTAALAFPALQREASVRARTAGSRERYARARRTLAGGVSSGLRRQARPYPLYFREGRGARITDVDGNCYLDYALAWGPLILGHAPDALTAAIGAQLRRGMTFGAQHDLEYELAELLTEVIPCADQVCFANSGTEIVEVALRLARAATGRHKHLKFEGHYHGWADSVLLSYHPSRAEIGLSLGAPVPVGAGQLAPEHVLVAEWNDRRGVEAIFREHGSEIASVICEPLLANSGCIPPQPGFLEFLRSTTLQYGALLIFDEVITGFRLHLAGAQGWYGVTPDLATYAKAVGGGTALSVLAGRSAYMDLIASGKVVHAGTLNGNPLSLAAARAALHILMRDNGAALDRMRCLGLRLRGGLESILRSRGHRVVSSGEGAVFHLSFMETPARCYRDLLRADEQLYSDFAVCLLSEGVLVLPDGRWYLSLAHTDADVDQSLEAAERACRSAL